jgi:transposase-like protein
VSACRPAPCYRRQSQAQVARQLGVAHQNVSRRHAQWRRGGLEALARRGPTGTAPRLSDQQLHDIDPALHQGARANGFDTDHWTLAWLRRQRSWLVVEPLPAYAPELNPVEGLWASLKGVELANLAGDTLQEVTAAAERGVQRIRGTPHLAFSFLRHCGLSLWPGASSRSSRHPDEHRRRVVGFAFLPVLRRPRPEPVGPQTVMTIFPRACPSSRYRMASGAARSG